MGRLSDTLSNTTSYGGGRLSGVVTSPEAIESKKSYYKRLSFIENYNKRVQEAEERRREAEEAQKRLAKWEGIASIPREIYNAAKETTAAILDVAQRASVPGGAIEQIRSFGSGVSAATQRKEGVPFLQAFEKGQQEFLGRETLFEKTRGKSLTKEEGGKVSIDPEEARMFIGRAAEAPLYFYGAIGSGAMQGTGLLKRLLVRTGRAMPEATVQTGLQTFEEGSADNLGTNFLANALLMSGISNVTGEVKQAITKRVFRNVTDKLETSLNRKLDLGEKADVKEALEQGVKSKTILKNVENAKTLDPNTQEDIIAQSIAKSSPETEIYVGDKDGNVNILKEGEVSKPSEKKLQLETKETVKQIEATPGSKEVKQKSVDTRPKSVTAQRLNERLPEELRIDETYDQIAIINELDKAATEISQNKTEAIRKAYDTNTGATKRAALLTELNEIAIREGDNQAAAELSTELAKVSTETGQALNMFKASVALNPQQKYMSDVVNARLGRLTVGKKDIANAKKKGLEIVKETEKKIKKIANESYKIQEAESLLDSLIC